MAEAAFEIGGEGRFDEDGVVEFLDVGGDAEDGHGFEPAERVAAFEEFAGVAFVQGAGDEEGDVVDHVAVGEVVHEFGDGARGLGLEVAEFGDEFIGGFGGEGGGGGVGGEGGEEVAIGGGELQFDICLEVW